MIYILILTSDLDDVLTEKSCSVFKCFSGHMNAQLDQYTLRQWRKLLGEEKTNEVKNHRCLNILVFKTHY